MRFNRLIDKIEKYYSKKVAVYGAAARGVDWNSEESQELRFEQVLKICDRTTPFTINDYGCGYGALAAYMRKKNYMFRYRGFDVSRDMIAEASRLFAPVRHCRFFTGENLLSPADYTVASGIFNVKLDTSERVWKAYVLATLKKIAALSRKGFAFNMLTTYADKKRMRDDLYYAEPLYFFDICKKNFSRFVTLLHDYPLFEFTVLVRME